MIETQVLMTVSDFSGFFLEIIWGHGPPMGNSGVCACVCVHVHACMHVCACMCVWVPPPSPLQLYLSNSKMVKPVSLTLCNIY